MLYIHVCTYVYVLLYRPYAVSYMLGACIIPGRVFHTLARFHNSSCLARGGLLRFGVAF